MFILIQLFLFHIFSVFSNYHQSIKPRMAGGKWKHRDHIFTLFFFPFHLTTPALPNRLWHKSQSLDTSQHWLAMQTFIVIYQWGNLYLNRAEEENAQGTQAQRTKNKCYISRETITLLWILWSCQRTWLPKTTQPSTTPAWKHTHNKALQRSLTASSHSQQPSQFAS